MITTWLVKVVVGIGLFGLAVFEAGSPFITRVQVDDAANRIADSAAINYFQSGDVEAARAEGEATAKSEGVVITEFDLTAQGTIRVVVSRQARSVVMHNLSFAKDWYDVTAQAEASPRRRDL